MRTMKAHIGVLVLLALACTPLSLPEERLPVVCEVYTAGETKGAGQTTSASLQTSGIGLFAWRTDAGTPFSGTESYLANGQFAYDGSSATWRQSGAYWPFGSWLSFFAYAPYLADVSAGALEFPSSDYVSGYPRLQYTPAALAASQVDLCLATPVMNAAVTDNAGVVPLSFSHVLTRLCIQACWNGTPAQVDAFTAAGQTIRVQSIVLRNVAVTNKLTYSAASFLWDTPAAFDGSYTMSVANGSFRSVDLPAAAGTFSSSFWNIADACLYVLPQSLSASSEMEVVFEIYSSGGSLISQETVTFDIGGLVQHVWPAGMEMTYSVTLDLTGHYAVEADVTFDCNAGAFVAPGSMWYDSTQAGSFLGGNFLPAASQAGTFGSVGAVASGSTAGSFIE